MRLAVVVDGLQRGRPAGAGAAELLEAFVLIWCKSITSVMDLSTEFPSTALTGAAEPEPVRSHRSGERRKQRSEQK